MKGGRFAPIWIPWGTRVPRHTGWAGLRVGTTGTEGTTGSTAAARATSRIIKLTASSTGVGCSFGSAGMDATSIVVRGKARKIPRTNALQQLYRSMHTDLIPSSKRCCGPTSFRCAATRRYGPCCRRAASHSCPRAVTRNRRLIGSRSLPSDSNAQRGR